MNAYDPERMAEALEPQGYALTRDLAEADLVILNTCHIREKAAEKVYSELGRVRIEKERRKAEGLDTLIAVAGCVAQAEGHEIIARASVVDIVGAPQSYHRLAHLSGNAPRAAVVLRIWSDGRAAPMLISWRQSTPRRTSLAICRSAPRRNRRPRLSSP